MDKKFFGQHIAARMILFALKGNSQRSNYNKKPLVMSFHGPSGCGKNFVADLIADNIFSSKKMKKSRYHLFHGHEYPKLSKLNQYKVIIFVYFKNVKNKIHSFYNFKHISNNNNLF